MDESAKSLSPAFPSRSAFAYLSGSDFGAHPTRSGKTFAVRPRKLPYKPVIGELENRTEYGSCDL